MSAQEEGQSGHPGEIVGGPSLALLRRRRRGLAMSAQEGQSGHATEMVGGPSLTRLGHRAGQVCCDAHQRCLMW